MNMLNIRKSRWLKSLVIGLVSAMLMPVMAFGAADNMAVAAEDTVVGTENVTDAETPAETAEPTPTPDPIETNKLPNWPQASDISSAAACLIDANTGAVLYNKNMYEKMYPASTTKVMTALIALENAALDEIVIFTETGVAEVYSGSSNLYTQVGEEFTMDDCLYALLLKSANDFASQIAEHVGGSVEAFCQMMNEKAASLGCVNTHFNNAHGMPDENHYTCAYDMALIMREAIKNETFRKVIATQSHVIPATSITAKRTVTSHNELVMPGEYYYEDCLGGKTGYTDSAMHTFVSAAERNGVTLIEATMHSPSSIDSFINAKALFEYGFNNFTNHVMMEGNNIYSGGSVTLPNGVVPDDIEIEIKDGDIFNTAFGNMIQRYYLQDGYQIGEVAITEESYLEEQRLIEEAEAKMKAEREAEHQRLQELKNNILSEPMLDPISDEMFTTSHIIIGAFIILIGIGIIAIVVTLIVKSVRKHKKRKERERKKLDDEMGMKQMEDVVRDNLDLEEFLNHELQTDVHSEE